MILALNSVEYDLKSNSIFTKDHGGGSAWQPCKPLEIHTSILHLRTINMPVDTK